MDTPRDVILKTLNFETPDRLGHDFPDPFGSDIHYEALAPSPDARPYGEQHAVDEWGAVWENLGGCQIGEVRQFPLVDWDDWDQFKIPDIRDPERYSNIKGARDRAGDRFLMGFGISLYERIHFIRGLENTWTDIYTNPDELGHLIDVLADMNIHVLEQYAREGFDGMLWPDDWGLQDRLMIDPEQWRELWKPRYARVYARARDLGIKMFLHSCGNIMSILDDLIEIGLDAINMDQQQNMGLDNLSERFQGRITFFNPVDIQNMMIRGSMDEIRAYCRLMFDKLGGKAGGLIPKWYTDPAGAGHSSEAINTMCETFLEISSDVYGQ